MTRFFITIEQSVEFVINSFKRMRGGEIFIPKLPSIKIVDIIKAINLKPKINIIGIRQGEKVHETLGGKDESRNMLEYSNHYLLLPNLESKYIKRYLIDPITKERGKKVSKDFEYVSNTNKRLTINSIRKILNNLSMKLIRQTFNLNLT